MLRGGHGCFPFNAMCGEPAIRLALSKPRPRSELGGGCEFAGVDLLSPFGLHAGDLEAAVGADDGEAVGFDRDDLAQLAGDALGVLGRQRLGVENLKLLAVERGPRARRRIAAADEPVDLLPWLAPVDLGVA